MTTNKCSHNDIIESQQVQLESQQVQLENMQEQIDIMNTLVHSILLAQPLGTFNIQNERNYQIVEVKKRLYATRNEIINDLRGVIHKDVEVDARIIERQLSSLCILQKNTDVKN